jgi:hypothetical protein
VKEALLVALVCILVPIAASATPYVPVGVMSEAVQGSEEWAAGAPRAQGLLTYDAFQRFTMCCQFITTLQVADTGSADFGGIREAEHMLGVIQSDNTSESIWMWSHYYRLSGIDLFGGNTGAAWEYIMGHKAYNEEGDDSPIQGYYRRYNCSWALRAVMEYSDVYGDATYAGYGDSCASYLCHHPMILNVPVGAARRLNGMIMGWAVGNLYEYGQYTSNLTYVSKALDMADSVKGWVETNPAKLHWKEWAMDGGAVMWGIVHSVFADDPTGLAAWVTTYAPNLDTEVLPSAGAYQNAWRGWAALGQSTAAEVLDSPAYAGYFRHLADTLVANDGDNDGGIPVLDADPDNYDQTWVTNYMGFMCMARLIQTAGAPAAGAPEAALRVVASPVPSHGLPDLQLNLAEASPVRASIYDASGRRVAQADFGLLGPGTERLSFAKAGGRPGVSPGIYFYEVLAGFQPARGKIVVMK